MSDIKLLHGDCLELLEYIPNGSVDTIVTSPPYNKSFFNRQSKSNQIWGGFGINYNSYSDNMPIADYEAFMIAVIDTCLNKLKPGGSLFFNHKPIRYNNQVYFPINFILRSKAKVYQEIIWNRHNSPNIRNDILVPCTERIYWLVKDKPKTFRTKLRKEFVSEVWDIYPKPCKTHPAPFPVILPDNCIKLTIENSGVVLDPFMGIGTTGIAALQNHCNFIGIELDEQYFKIAQERINDYGKDKSF